MQDTTITVHRFHAILDAIPAGADGIGFRRGEVYYHCARTKSGTYKGAPYSKPARVQITTADERFWVELDDQALQFTFDPGGGFDPTPLDGEDAWRELERHWHALEDHLQIVRRKQRAAAGARPDVDAADVRAFIEAMLCGADPGQRAAVQKAVALALTSPIAYVAAHREPLARRGIAHPVPHLHVIAWVDAMQHIGAAAEVDWNAAPEEVVWAQVARLARRIGVELAPLAGAPDGPVDEMLQRLGQALADQGGVLVTIDIDADAYVLCAVPEETYAKSAVLAEKAGIRIDRR